MTKSRTLYCSFCGKSQHHVRKLIAGPTVFICDECTELCMDIIREEHNTPLVKSQAGRLSPSDIHGVLDNHLGGAVRAKQALSAVLHDHYRRAMGDPEPSLSVALPPCILLSGPSLQRSEVLRALTRCLHLPIAAFEATGLLEHPTAEAACRSILLELLEAANFQLEDARHGIVFLDDSDQLGRFAADTGAAAREIQMALAEMMSGTVIEVPGDAGKAWQVDTTSMAFILGGTSFGLPKSAGRHGIDGVPRPGDAEAEALTAFGLLPDLVGCFTALVVLNAGQPEG